MSTSTPILPAFLRQSKSEIKTKFVDLEWAQRERLLHGTQQPASTSQQPSRWARLTGDAVASRNRYMNVEPYAANRVRLRVGEGENDYINASPIVLGERRYIATQGPKESGVGHFWRMVEEVYGAEGGGKGRAVVVMLTQTHEAGKEKCFQYYPLEGGESPMNVVDGSGWGGEVVLEGVEEAVAARCQVRRMRLRVRARQEDNDGAVGTAGTVMDGSAASTAREDSTSITTTGAQEEVEVTHLLFSGWPDFLIPEGDDRAALVNLVALSATLNAPTPSSTNPNQTAPSIPTALLTDQSTPRIIHCSAGVGRSGTFIALDYLLSLLHSGELDELEEGRDPIAETVDELRKQRMMMVQGESQFNFLYEALREAVEERGRGR